MCNTVGFFSLLNVAVKIFYYFYMTVVCDKLSCFANVYFFSSLLWNTVYFPNTMTSVLSMKKHDSLEVLTVLVQFNLAYVSLDSSVRKHGLHQHHYTQPRETDLNTSKILELFSIELKPEMESLNRFQKNPTEPQLTHRFLSFVVRHNWNCLCVCMFVSNAVLLLYSSQIHIWHSGV